MKIRQLSITLIIVLPVGILCYWWGQKSVSRPAEESHPVTLAAEKHPISEHQLKIENKTQRIETLVKGKIAPPREIQVRFEVSGKLLSSSKNWMPGMAFRKNQLLFQLDNEEAYYKLTALKQQLKEKLNINLSEITSRFPSEKSKWQQFMTGIRADDLMPFLPLFKNETERQFFTEQKISSLYYEVMQAEARIKKFLYLAPFDGQIVKIYEEDGSTIMAGKQIAIIQRNELNELLIEVPETLADYYLPDTKIKVMNPAGKFIGTGELTRSNNVVDPKSKCIRMYGRFKSTPKQGVFYNQELSISLLMNPTVQACLIPNDAYEKGVVNIRVQQDLQQVPVRLLHQQKDSLLVEGLTDGMVLVW